MWEQTMTLAAITFSEVMVTLHILGVVVAFGGALAYPIWFRKIRNGTPEQRALLPPGAGHAGQVRDQHPSLVPGVLIARQVRPAGENDDDPGDQDEYDTVLRRVKLGMYFLGVLVIAATLMIVARVPESDEAEPADEAAPAGAQTFVETGCGSCHTLAAAGTNGTVGPNLDEEAAGRSAAGIRDAIADHPDDFESQLSDRELETLARFVAAEAGSR